jgi:hypothetical protein
MVNAKIDIFGMPFEESSFYSKRFENLETIRYNNNPVTLPVDKKKPITVTSNVGKYSKNPKYSDTWYHNHDKNNHNTADCRAMDKIKQQKKAHFETKSGLRKKYLISLPLFEVINALKAQFISKRTASHKNTTIKIIISPLY